MSTSTAPTLIFDLETQLLSDDVGGWSNIAKMKLACAVTYNLTSGEFTDYLEADVDKLLADLRTAGLVVGFNTRRFDYEVLRPYAGKPLQLPTLDMLENIYQTLGFRLSLDSVAAATLNHSKSADGLQAVAWFKAGQVEKVLDYCRQDVQVTRELYDYGQQHKHLKYRDKFGRVKTVAVKW
ncbi:MAG: ribonuclease H-like domain-containing protein [Chloroflexi bacterium]|nr:ribonuclease H-like domain-containing protein [Chloroflexota bacterium]